MTSKNNRAPLLYYIKLCASFQIHRWIQIEVTVRKLSIRIKIGDFLSRVTLKFDGWPWKIIRQFFYITSSFVHHFKAMGEFKPKLQSGNAQFRSKSAIFLSRVTFIFDERPWKKIGHIFYTTSRSISKIFLIHVTFKFDGWPSKTTGYLFYGTSSFVHLFVTIGEFKLEIQFGNAQFGSKSTIFLAL